MWNYDYLPFIVGGGGFMIRNVYVYSCNNCGNQYHLISLPSFFESNEDINVIVF